MWAARHPVPSTHRTGLTSCLSPSRCRIHSSARWSFAPRGDGHWAFGPRFDLMAGLVAHRLERDLRDYPVPADKGSMSFMHRTEGSLRGGRPAASPLHPLGGGSGDSAVDS